MFFAGVFPGTGKKTLLNEQQSEEGEGLRVPLEMIGVEIVGPVQVIFLNNANQGVPLQMDVCYLQPYRDEAIDGGHQKCILVGDVVNAYPKIQFIHCTGERNLGGSKVGSTVSPNRVRPICSKSAAGRAIRAQDGAPICCISSLFRTWVWSQRNCSMELL